MIKEIIFQPSFFRLTYRVLRWHFSYLAFGNASPLACGIYVTTKCNFHCSFCNIWRIKSDFQISKDDAKKIIKELGTMGLIYLAFGGGETLLVPHIFDLLSYAKECGVIYTHLVSNGYLMDSSKAKALRDVRVSEISFSLDGDEDIHDRNRGVDGAFKRVIEAVEYVKVYAPKVKIVLNSILNPIDPESAICAIKIARRLKVKIKIQPLNKHPDFGITTSSVAQKPIMRIEEKENVLEAIKSIQNSPCVVNSKSFFENYKAFLFSKDKVLFDKEDCIFGYHHIEIFANQLFPCLEGLNWSDGFEIQGKPLNNILRSTVYRNKLRQLRKCHNCKKSYYICYYEPRLNFPIWNFIKSSCFRADNLKINA